MSAGLELIREAPKKLLRDQEWLETAVRDLGVYPAQEIPRRLWQQDPPGGLGIAQFPNQVAPYLIAVSKLDIKSYAEIGLWVGGTFILTVEYLRRFGLERALGIDIVVQQSVSAYVHSQNGFPIELVQKASQTDTAEEALRAMKPDLVLIDGDHTEEGCRLDWQMAKRHARYVAIHDIVGSGYPGVQTVWQGIKGRKREWVDQYENSQDQNGMGLVKVR